MTNQEQAALTVALAYAKDRWCWDDEPLITELFEAEYGPDDAPERFVDYLAYNFDLTDPREGWGWHFTKGVPSCS